MAKASRRLVICLDNSGYEVSLDLHSAHCERDLAVISVT
jgi:hypothetical protein